MTDFSLPDFGMLLGLRDQKLEIATHGDIVKPSPDDDAPCVEYGEVTVAFNELPTQIQDFEEATSTAPSNGGDRMQRLHAQLALGVTPNGEYTGATPFLSVPIDDMVSADHVLLKSEYDTCHYGGDCCWSPDRFTPPCSGNQLSRRWSSPSYSSASEAYAMQCAGYDDCGCPPPNRTSPFMVGEVVSCEPFQVNSHPTELQCAGSQQALVDMCEVLDPTRTVQTNHPTTCYNPFSHVRAKSTSFTEDLLRCTSMSDDLSTTSQTEELDEVRINAHARAQTHIRTRTCIQTHAHTHT